MYIKKKHVQEIGHWLNLESTPETQMISSYGSQSCCLLYAVFCIVQARAIAKL